MLVLLGVVIGQVFCISLGEWMLWKLFCHRRVGMEFPREVDDSPFRFLSNKRLGVCIFCHTVFLFSATSIATLLLW